MVSGPCLSLWTRALLCATLVKCVCCRTPTGRRGFTALMRVLGTVRIHRSSRSFGGTISLLFSTLRRGSPSRFTLHRCGGCGLTTKGATGSVLVSYTSELTPFSVGRIERVAVCSRLSLSVLKSRQATLFLVVDSASKAFTFLVDLVCSVLFGHLYRQTSSICKNELPVRIHYLVSRTTGVKRVPGLRHLVTAVQDHRVSTYLILRTRDRLGTLCGSGVSAIVNGYSTSLFLKNGRRAALGD